MKILVSYLQTLIFKHHQLKHCLIRSVVHTFSAKSIIPIADSSKFKTSLLENKWGLSKKALLTASKYVNFDSYDQRPDSIVELLRTTGFPLSSITNIISSYPLNLYSYHPELVIKPKLNFLLSVTQCQADVVTIVT